MVIERRVRDLVPFEQWVDQCRFELAGGCLECGDEFELEDPVLEEFGDLVGDGESAMFFCKSTIDDDDDIAHHRAVLDRHPVTNGAVEFKRYTILYECEHSN